MKKHHNPIVEFPVQMGNVIAIHAEMMRRLADHGRLTLEEWGEIMEDVGNQYLGIADQIRIYVISSRADGESADPSLSAQSWPPEDRAETHPGSAWARTEDSQD